MEGINQESYCIVINTENSEVRFGPCIYILDPLQLWFQQNSGPPKLAYQVAYGVHDFWGQNGD